MTSISRLLLLAALLSAVAFAILGVHLPTDDDWWTISSLLPERGNLVRFAFRPYAHHWHPFFFLGPGLAVTLDPVGYGIGLVRVLNALAVFASAGALAVSGRTLGFSMPTTALGMALFTFDQATVGVFRQWDGFGHLWGDAIARWLFVGLLLIAHQRGPRWLYHPLAALGTMLLGFVAVTGTERVIGTVTGTLTWFGPALLGSVWRSPPAWFAQLQRPQRSSAALFRFAFGLVGALLLFVVVRTLLKTPNPTGGGDRYAYAPLLGMVRNAAQMTYALVTPISTFHTFYWFSDGERVRFLGAAGLTALIAVAWLYALARSVRRSGYAASALSAMLVSFFPMALLVHVSEHYVAGAAFFFVLSMMVALDEGFRELSARSLAASRLLLASTACYLAVHLISFASKEAIAARTGERDRLDGRMLYSQLQGLPAGAGVSVVHDVDRPRTYSSYNSRSGDAVAFVEAAGDGRPWVQVDDGAVASIRLTSRGEFIAAPSTAAAR